MSFRNPVISGFHPDPSLCRVGDKYFLATSSFTYFPGVPIFRSANLVDWEQIGNALDRPSQLDLTGTEDMPSGGVFAPTLRHYDGRFWMITTTLRQGTMTTAFVTADDPAGPWSEPVVVDVPGIDPDLAWDDDGNCWVHSGLAAIFRSRIDPTSGAVLDGPHQTWSGIGLQFPEAPHLYRREDWWYLMIAEGGTERGHAASIARGPSPEGPWEPCPANPIVSHRSTDRPIQSTGHGDLVEAPDGQWWMVLLASRPRGYTPGFHVLGRETFLVPVDWVDDWPVARDLALHMPDEPPAPATGTDLAVRDPFDGAELGPEWLTVRRPLGESLSLTERPAAVRLRGQGGGLDDPYPTFVGRRQQLETCRVRVTVAIDDALEAGLAVRMDEDHHVSVAVVDAEVVVRARIGPLSEIIGRIPMSDGPTRLGIDVEPHPAGFLGGPDQLVLGIDGPDAGFEALAALDGRYLSTEVAGGFIGRVIGCYAVGGDATFEGFEIVPSAEPSGAT